MWMIMGLMGLLVASSMADALIKVDNGGQGANEDDNNQGTALAEDRGDTTAEQTQTTSGDLMDYGTESVPDPWLGEWRDDSFVSTEGEMPEERPHDDMPPDSSSAPLPDPYPADPWMDGWGNDSFVSSDFAPPPGTPADSPPFETSPDDTLPDNTPTVPGGSPGDTPPPDPWLDGWRDTVHVSSDIPGDLTALVGGAQAVHVLGAGEMFDTGGGEGAFVIGDWIGNGTLATIRGFDPVTDALIFAYDADLGAPRIEVTPAPDGSSVIVLIEDHPVLSLEGVAEYDAGSVRLYPIRLGN